ncbi:MAG: GUN4 domain-containing protein [Cyanobacterium sp. T60_A2020_053]|nr:GUN4 domain-containing protein [Cyanobacterium sp. T60_A2020_053]
MSYWKAGTIIQKGKYVIEKVLGAGGAGITYRAKNTKNNGTVAIKTLNATIQAQPNFKKHQERFIQEAFRLAKCSHPHVIRVDDVCQEGELWCMMMEYIDGGNLETVAKKQGKLAEKEAIKYISDIASALNYIHERGILHRDVKPANIMIRKETNEAVLIDFGLAREFVTDQTQIHTNSRTEGFAPLEQYLRSARRGAYTDVYALSATLYYVLTLQIPFPAQFRNQGMALISPQQHNPDISYRTCEAIIKGMELEAEARPQSVGEWLTLLSDEITLNAIEFESETETEPDLPLLPLPPLPKKRSKTKEKPSQTATIAPPTASSNYDPFAPERFIGNSLPPQQQKVVATFFAEISQNNLKNIEEVKTVISSPNTVIEPDHISLPSAVGMDYRALEELLKAEKWAEADHKTNELMLKVVKKGSSGWIDRNTMAQFPCEDFSTIDQLWVKYSQGKFGFSVQKRIYQSLGGKRNYDKKIWDNIGDKLGWRSQGIWLFKDSLIYDLSAPLGHLPSLANSGILERGIYTLMARAMDCNI